MGPVVAVFPDCFTSLGGNQYINSPAMGNWADFLTLEMLPEIESRFRVRRGREHRAIFGKSSGGYGAVVHGMTRAACWGAVAVHSGDMGFDRLLGEFPKTVNAVNKHGGYEGFLKHLDSAKRVEEDDMAALMVLAMGATYDPDPDGPKGIRLPVDLHTCGCYPSVGNNGGPTIRWRMIRRRSLPQNLRRLSDFTSTAGARDQFHFTSAPPVVRRLQARHPHRSRNRRHALRDRLSLDESLPYL